METTVDQELLIDRKGNIRTGLIREVNQTYRRNKPPVYTMKPLDHDKYISLYKLYMECVDEYEFAATAFGSMDNFKVYQEMSDFMLGPHESSVHQYKGLREWRKEKELHDKAVAKKLLWESAKKGNVTAQKILYDGDKQAGRPSKAKVSEEARKQAEQDKILKEGLERIQKIRLVSTNENVSPASYN